MSSCEAEYIAATAATCQAMWMNPLISELKGKEQMTVKLMVDNQSAIMLSKNPIHPNWTKHIDTRYHFIRQCVEDKKIDIFFVRMENQLTDIFTKALGKVKFQEMQSSIGIQNIRMEELEQGGEWSQLLHLSSDYHRPLQFHQLKRFFSIFLFLK